MADPKAFQEAAWIVQSHLTAGKSPTFGPVTYKLVEYGIARLRDGHQGHIIEPLAFLSLMQWLETRNDNTVGHNIRLRLGIPDARGGAFEELIVLYLLQSLCYPTPLRTIFNFFGNPPPWAHRLARAVGRLEGHNVPVGILGDAPENSSPSVVHFAEHIDDIVQWIESQDAPAILISNNLFGPDVIIRCELSSPNSAAPPEDLFLMGQMKSCTESSTNSLNASTKAHDINSLHEDHWFKRVVSELGLSSFLPYFDLLIE